MSGDADLVAEHGEMVRKIAGRLASQLSLRREVDDLTASGFEGLVIARKRFDESRGVPFQAFAYFRIRGAIYDWVRKMSLLPQATLERLERIAAADAIKEAGGEERVAHGRPKVDVQARAAVIDEMLAQLTAAADAQALSQHERRGSDPEKALLTQLEHFALKKAMRALPERERFVIHAMYFEGRTAEDVGADPQLRLSKQMVSVLHKKALLLLREALE